NPASPTPLSMSMLSGHVLARMRTLGNIYVRVRQDCATDSVILRNYTFAYTADADTALPRLSSVKVSARFDRAEGGVTLPVANYSYGSASSLDASNQRVLAYTKLETLPFPTGATPGEISSTYWDSNVSLPPDAGTALATRQMLIDVTGDGRPDLVFPHSGKLWFAPNLPGGGGTSTFGSPLQLQDTMLTSNQFELRSSKSPSRYSYSVSQPFYTDNVWRMAIDMNGDGRIDLIDAA